MEIIITNANITFSNTKQMLLFKNLLTDDATKETRRIAVVKQAFEKKRTIPTIDYLSITSKKLIFKNIHIHIHILYDCET